MSKPTISVIFTLIGIKSKGDLSYGTIESILETGKGSSWQSHDSSDFCPKKPVGRVKVRSRCTRSKMGPRELTLASPKSNTRLYKRPESVNRAKTSNQRYKRRAGIEGTMSQAAFSLGMRRTRYRGLQKTHFHPYCHSDRDQSATLCGLDMGNAAFENALVTLCTT